MTDLPPLIVQGMHGMGDNLHQRGVLRQLMREHDVWLETSWAAMYHDLIADGLKVMRRPIRLRTQMKNQVRESENAIFTKQTPPRHAPTVRIMYHGHNVQARPSQTVLDAMCFSAGVSYDDADFRLPVPDEWKEPARRLLSTINGSGKPLLIYRPLVLRPEWQGNGKRNADPNAYAELFAIIRDRFFVLSVADLEPGREWIVGPRLKADKELHNGELPFEYLAGLFSLANLVFTSSGFATILAPAVGTPVISVVGGYERAVWHSAGERYAPYLGIEPIAPCICSVSTCGRECTKQIDIPVARAKIANFVANLGFEANGVPRTVAEMFEPAPPPEPVNTNLMRAMYPASRRVANPDMPGPRA